MFHVWTLLSILRSQGFSGSICLHRSIVDIAAGQFSNFYFSTCNSEKMQVQFILISECSGKSRNWCSWCLQTTQRPEKSFLIIATATKTKEKNFIITLFNQMKNNFDNVISSFFQVILLFLIKNKLYFFHTECEAQWLRFLINFSV